MHTVQVLCHVSDVVVVDVVEVVDVVDEVVVDDVVISLHIGMQRQSTHAHTGYRTLAATP